MRATLGEYVPNTLGYTRAAMLHSIGCNSERRSQSSKSIRGSDRGLQLTLVNVESLVTTCHHRAVNTSLLLAHTARRFIQMRLG